MMILLRCHASKLEGPLQIGHFRVPLCACFKTSLRADFSYENMFALYEKEPVSGTNFHMNGFARRIVLTQRQRQFKKWPIIVYPLQLRKIIEMIKEGKKVESYM